MASNTVLAGRMNAGSSTVNFWPPGQTNSFIIVGWNVTEGSTWATVAARLGSGHLIIGGFIGATTVGFRQAGGVTTAGTIPTPLLFGSGPDAQGQPITTPTDLFLVTPEPSSTILVAFGFAALTILRWRRPA
jgi:hypothetical protein